IYFLRDLLLYKSTSSINDILERAFVDEAFTNLAKEVSIDWIQSSIIELNNCQQEIKWTNSPKVFIEITLLTITNRYNDQTEEKQTMKDESTESLQQLQQQVAALEKKVKSFNETSTAP